ncbi:hypothetical protein [Pseudomonas gingeri]|uniref:hypothetical protein n=1 Tax=Pseudomonas gingeri TaxID=117681 RepID=UPI0015A04E24|nr:hypothetical protein [Pseudomonas gingeri]NWA10816.1 hypothetical protein [Pseudomonas gingeri]
MTKQTEFVIHTDGKKAYPVVDMEDLLRLIQVGDRIENNTGVKLAVKEKIFRETATNGVYEIRLIVNQE